MSLKIFRTSSSFVDPGKRGRPVYISAMMHPTDQISIEVEYVRDPRSTSGARYHSVTTSFENVFTGIPKALFRRVSVTGSSHLTIDFLPSESEITQFQLTSFVDQQVLRLQISVKDAVVVTKGNGLQQLKHEALNNWCFQSTILAVVVHVFLQIRIHLLHLLQKSLNILYEMKVLTILVSCKGQSMNQI